MSDQLLQTLPAGFDPQELMKQIKPRIILLVWSHNKGGKTHFSIMTTPEPVAYLNFDKSFEDVVSKAIKSGRKIYPKWYQVNSPSARPYVGVAINSTENKLRMEQEQSAYKNLFDTFLADYEQLLRHPQIRTVVVDNTTVLYNIVQIAQFGRLSNNNKFQYQTVNQDMKQLIDMAGRSDKNVIFTARAGKVYVGDNWNGELSADGWKGLPYEVQAELQTWRGGDGKFYGRIITSSHDPLLVNREFTSDPAVPRNELRVPSPAHMLEFPFIAGAIYRDHNWWA